MQRLIRGSKLDPLQRFDQFFQGVETAANFYHACAPRMRRTRVRFLCEALTLVSQKQHG